MPKLTSDRIGSSAGVTVFSVLILVGRPEELCLQRVTIRNIIGFQDRFFVFVGGEIALDLVQKNLVLVNVPVIKEEKSDLPFMLTYLTFGRLNR